METVLSAAAEVQKILRGPQQVLRDIFGKKRRQDQIEYGTKALRRTNVHKAGKYAVQVRGYTNW